jgi:DNA ligase (NAD+)
MYKEISKISKYNDIQFYDYINSISVTSLNNIKTYLDDQYYNTCNSFGIDDYYYDIIFETLKKKSKYILPVGSVIREGENRVKLPFWLGSMTKFKIDSGTDISKWMIRNKSDKYIVEEKLDGVSCMAVFNDGNIKLYTRGDGVVGADISILAQYFNSIPKKLVYNLVVRGELIIKKDIFEKKYSESYANPRNFVAGRTGAKIMKEGMEDITFVAYEIVGDGIMPPPSEQLTLLKKMGFITVCRKIIPTITIDILSKTLLKFRESSSYEIDGIILQPDITYERNITGNPEYAFAFKMRMSSNLAETQVIKIHWNISKWGYLKPRIEIEPVKLSGVTITYTTGFNASYIVSNNLGPGAKIEITRSGDVIPYITKVISGSPSGSEMPDVEYKWNKTGVDIMVLELGADMFVKSTSDFFCKMDMKFIGEKTVLKLYEDGLDSLIKIISAPLNRLLKVPGIGDRGAERIYNNIHTHLKNMDMPFVLGASGIFGFGISIKRVTLLFQNIPDILDIYKKMNRLSIKEKISAIDGFGDVTVENIVDNLVYADRLVDEMKKIGIFNVKKILGDDLKNMKAVFTGFRDTYLTEKVISMGGKVSSGGITGTTTVLVHSPSKDGKESKKIVDAKKKDIPIYTKDEFIAKYLSNI